MSAISAKGLTKRYGKQAAVDGISFEIPAGRIVGLIGPNGSGKTTTLKAALGLVPFEGELSVLGKDPRTQRDELMQDVDGPHDREKPVAQFSGHRLFGFARERRFRVTCCLSSPPWRYSRRVRSIGSRRTARAWVPCSRLEQSHTRPHSR